MLPTSIIAGDTLKFSVEAAGEVSAASGWTLAFKISGNGASADGVATADGTGWLVTVAASATAPLAAGIYGYALTATKAAERITLERGTISILADIATAANTIDARTTARQNLDLVSAAITARLAGKAVAEYTIGSRSLRYSPIAELLTLKAALEREVAAEESAARVAAGLKSGKRIGVRFA